MSTTTTTTTIPTAAATSASQVRLSPEHLGKYGTAEDPSSSVELANKLLQKNHDDFHVFWRDVNGHNHMAHSLLTVFALGASPSEIQRAYEDGLAVQRPSPELDEAVVSELHDDSKFLEKVGDITQYTNFLVFFERQIEVKGWQAVITEYCFSRTAVADAVLARLYEGAFHPIIHLGLGVEFEQPSIVAEGLAQAVTHSSSRATEFFQDAEKEVARSNPTGKPLVELIDMARADDTIRNAAHWTDFANKVRDGVLGRSATEIAKLAAQYRVKPDEIERRCAEIINGVAYLAGSAQRHGKNRKIDFFHMHAVTSSIFLTVLTRQPWISVENKCRLVEWKGRLDLVWYAASAAAELDTNYVVNYKGEPSGDMDWQTLFKTVNATHDDGHVAKFVRALKNGEEVSKPFESGEGSDDFPIKGDMWLKLARMAYDTTLGVPLEAKWIWGAGFDQPWGQVAAKEE